MKIQNTFKAVSGAIVCGALLLAQTAAIPVVKQPQPKSPKEIEAIVAMQNAMQSQNMDATITAAENLITRFADTEFKTVALQIIAGAYQAKGQPEKAVIYAERLLEADPKSYTAMLMIATITAQQTREHDLDREEKLAKVEKMALAARELIKDAPKPRAEITDEQWVGIRKDLTAQTHEAMALTAQARKKYDVAIAEYKKAVESSSNPDPATLVRLGALYNQSNQPDEAIAVLDRAAADQTALPQVKQAALNEKAKAQQLKVNKSATPPAKP